MSFSTSVRPFGPGKIVELRTPALRVSISTLGATVYSVQVFQPKMNKWVEVNVHYTNYEEALADGSTYFGATVGRFAGRIGFGRFTVDNKEYHTPCNAGEHTIHGGGNAFDKKHWGFEVLERQKSVGVRFRYVSPHMENGFPADLVTTVYYHIDEAAPNALHMDFEATVPETSPADATIANIFNHCYWNLNGVPEHPNDEKWEQAEPVVNHWVRLPRCDLIVDTDMSAIPSGKLLDPTPELDFRRARELGPGINDVKTLNRDPCGFDHPYFISGFREGGRKQLNAECYSPKTDIKMDVYSTYPCVWLYTANNLKAGASGCKGERFARHTAVCIEPQELPDNANHESFVKSGARKGQPYRREIVNVFTIGKPSKM